MQHFSVEWFAMPSKFMQISLVGVLPECSFLPGIVKMSRRQRGGNIELTRTLIVISVAFCFYIRTSIPAG